MAAYDLQGRVLTLAAVMVMALPYMRPGRSLAQEQVVLTSGKLEYQQYCAVCHGPEGNGTGPMADLLKKQPADLTRLSKKNRGGQFPFWRVYRTIDGREEVMAHGPRTMPIWGAHFLTEEGGGPLDEERVIGRILALVYYLESLQAK
jgi:mono/diheme cytochrome c family protein